MSNGTLGNTGNTLMNKNVVFAVARRDLRSWFGNPTGYVFIILFVLLAVGALLVPDEFFRNNLANLDTLNGYFPWLAILLCAAITMGTWSSERASGTQELLFTLPARDSELLLGKYLAALGIYSVALLFTLTMPIGLSFLGMPDWGQIFANYFGFWLFGAMVLAVTMLGSQASENMTVSLIVGALCGAAVVYFGHALNVLGFGSGWIVNGPIGQFQEFGRGMVPLSGIVLFVGLASAFLYLNLAILASRHYRRDQHEGAHRVARFAALGIGIVALTAIGVHALPRIDTTFERIHSLGEESRELLAQLDPDKPVNLTVFVSEEVPPALVQQKRNLLNLVDQFDRIGGGAIRQRIVFPEPFSPEAKEAQDNYGIQASTMPVDEGGVYSEMTVFLGFVAQSGTEEVVVPFLGPGVPLEYELTRSIRVAAKADRRKVGVLKTDVELYGGFDFQTFRQKQRWQIVDELMLQYEVENVDAAEDYPADLDALIVPQPSSLEQEQMDRLQSWILAGNKALLLEDPAPLDAPGTAATDQKGGARNQLMGGPPPGQKGNFAGFLASFGASMPTDQVVWDLSYRTFAAGALPPEFLFVGEEGFSDDEIVTSGLDRAVVLLGGHVRQQAKEGWSFTPLLRSPMPRGDDMNGTIPKLNVFVFNPFGGGQQLDPRRRWTPRPDDYVLAARLTGPLKATDGDSAAGDGSGGSAGEKTGEGAGEKDTAGKETGAAKPGRRPQVVLIADLDLVGNQFFEIRRRLNDPNMRFDNVTLVLNCIDSLVGDESLIELRKRRPVLRKLEAVEEAQQDYERTWLDEREAAEAAAQKELDEAQARLDEAVERVRENKDLDAQAKEIQIQTIQNNENRKLEIRKAQIEDEKNARIRLAQHTRDAHKRDLYNGYRLLMLMLAALPALAMGFVTWSRRRRREASIVPDNRLVK